MRTSLSIALPLIVLASSRPQERMFDTWIVIDQQGAYRTFIDTQIFHGGAASGHIAALSPTTTASMIVSQAVRADAYRGKRVRFSAWLRTRDVVKSSEYGARLFLRAEGEGATLASYSTGSRPVGGNTEWTKQQIVLDIPATTIGLTFGFGVGGPGEVWIDDASLEPVGLDVPVNRAGARPPPPSAAKTRQQQAAYAKKPTHPSNMDFERAK